MKKIKKIIAILLLSNISFSILSNQSEKLSHQSQKKIITIIGTGYVGLVTGAGLAELGNTVICADIDVHKISRLQQGEIPIYEQGLKHLVDHNVAANRLFFTNNVGQAIQDATLIFVAVNTPMGEDGAANLTALKSVVQSIAQHINNHKIIVIKSTVPVGTGQQVRTLLEQQGVAPTMFDMVSNPEFLREGSAVNDFLAPDRLVIGAESNYAIDAICKIYEPLIMRGTPHVLTNIVTAEITKYAANAFLATKVSFINEIANLCDTIQADAQTVALALGLDSRINPKFLKFGPGFGGSCFPKDTEALLYTAQQHGINLHTVHAAIQANKMQQKKPAEKLFKLMKNYFGDEHIKGKTATLLGLAFKANTDDIRYSPAIQTINLLLQHGIQVKVYDPAAMQNMQQLFPDITYCSSAYEAVTDTDAIIVMTEWDEFKQMNIDQVSKLMRTQILVDARNILNPIELKQKGFLCDTIGQSYLCLQEPTTQQLTKSYRTMLSE
ncbi:MAG: UDP-glucose/GDP-mannose dehydrogenase family protein [Candidatus Babeliales bacterium]